MLGPERLRNLLIAAVPTPLDGSGAIDDRSHHGLVSWLSRFPIGGVAVGTLPGQGVDATSRNLSAWRAGLRDGQLLIAPAGPAPGLRLPDDLARSARSAARLAADLGADAVLVPPPGPVRGRPDRDRLVLEHHAEVAEAGLPTLISYRKESSGGIGYGPEVLAQLLARPEVVGVVIATIDGIVAFQQVEALAREHSPSKLVITGEERFLGYSLMCGADAALVGMGCVLPEVVLELMEAHSSSDAARFLDRNRLVDALARAIFPGPTDGRLLRALAHRGVVPVESSPRSGRDAIDRLGEALERLDPEGRWFPRRPEGSA